MAKKVKKEKVPASGIAILVDGDNASPAKLNDVIRFVLSYGQPIVKRIYADWTKSGMSQWKDVAKEHAFRLIEAPSYIKGKNTTDIALVMDAMDLLHSEVVSGFCIVSSDSDYALLAQRLREGGMLVLGYGESKTPLTFVNSCRKFEFSDQEPKKPETQESLFQKEKAIFDKAFDSIGKEEVTLSQLGMELKKLMHKFKVRRYGFKTLGALYESLENYEVIQTG